MSFLLDTPLSSFGLFGDAMNSVVKRFQENKRHGRKAFLHTSTYLHIRGYVPKVPSNTPKPIVLQAFCSPSFRDQDQGKLHLLCPVQALGRSAVRLLRCHYFLPPSRRVVVLVYKTSGCPLL